jgi:hypothetical protein
VVLARRRVKAKVHQLLKDVGGNNVVGDVLVDGAARAKGVKNLHQENDRNSLNHGRPSIVEVSNSM